MDGVTNYDVYGSLRGGKNLGYVGTREKVTQYYQGEQREWKKLAQSKGCAFIPGTSPGFNDRGVRPEKDHIPLSRRLNLNAKEGSLFRAALQEARTLVDPQLDHLIMVNSFNEFHEDTQIEPVVAVDGSKGLGSQTNLPTNLTYGLEYEAYENLYLNILKQETKKWDVSSLAASAASTVASTSVTKAASTIQTEEMCIPSSTNEDITTISDIIGLELD
jgi:glycoprotein endo-alpha-1,2-mannosidase